MCLRIYSRLERSSVWIIGSIASSFPAVLHDAQVQEISADKPAKLLIVDVDKH